MTGSESELPELESADGEPPSMPEPVEEAPRPSGRVESVDALRGFDMFWILGGEHLVISLDRAGGAAGFGGLERVAEQMNHVAWEGFHFYDLIFPLFVFLVGVSTVFSLDRILETRGVGAAHWRVIRRFALLYFLGLFYHGAMSRDGDPETFRYMGVLHRIAICYLAGSLLYIHLRFRGLLIATVVLLVGYWAAMSFIPVPGGEAGNFAEGENLANWIDTHYLPGYKWDGDWDPEGILSTLPAIASGLMGIFAGLLLRRRDFPGWKRTGILVLVGLACLAIGWVWSFQFPVIKKLWTSSYVLVAAGWSYLLLALFFLVIDVGGLRLWARPFVWIGMNSITIYMANNLVGGFDSLVRRVLHAPVRESLGPWSELVVTALGLALALWVCRYLYRNKIFIRV